MKEPISVKEAVLPAYFWFLLKVFFSCGISSAVLQIQVFSFVQGKHISSGKRLHPQAFGDSPSIYFNKCHFQEREGNPKSLGQNSGRPHLYPAFPVQSCPRTGLLLLPLRLERSSAESRPNVCGLGPSHIISHILIISLLLVSHSHLEKGITHTSLHLLSQFVMTLPQRWL